MNPLLSISLLALVAGFAQAQDAKSLDDYKAEAAAVVDAISVEDALSAVGNSAVIFVDVRDGEEIERLGKVADAVHVSRGRLEFVVDPKSNMHKDIFSTGKKIVFYCATGGRSLLAAKLAHDMGVRDSVYLEGGFRAWAKADGPVDEN